MPIDPKLIKSAKQKLPDIEFIIITPENGRDVAEWCDGIWAQSFDPADTEDYWLMLRAAESAPRVYKVGDYICKRQNPDLFMGFTPEDFDKYYETVRILGEEPEIEPEPEDIVFEGTAVSCIFVSAFVCGETAMAVNRALLQWNYLNALTGGKVCTGIVREAVSESGITEIRGWSEFNSGDRIIRKSDGFFAVEKPVDESLDKEVEIDFMNRPIMFPNAFHVTGGV